MGNACRASTEPAAPPQEKNDNFAMRIGPRLKHEAKQAAADYRRSLSALIEILLIEHCKRHGFWKERRKEAKSSR
jgi:hypothetical protein